MNLQQNKMIHALLAQTNLTRQKANIVAGISQGRTESSKDLTDTEAQAMITYLKENIPPPVLDGLDIKADKMRKKIISYAWQMNWTIKINALELAKLPSSALPYKCDMNRLNAWCEKYGYLHKKLNDYSYQELPKLLTQFENMYNDYLKNI